MFHLSKRFQCQKVQLTARWGRRKNCIAPGNGKANFGTGERHVLTVGIDFSKYTRYHAMINPREKLDHCGTIACPVAEVIVFRSREIMYF